MWHIDEDRARKLLSVDVTSAPDPAELTRTKLQLKRRVAILRSVAGHARVLFDLSRYPGSPVKAVTRFQHVDGEFVQDAADRFALVVPRSLDKADTRALLKTGQAQVFISADAARTWLLAH